jgi:hypothetical protein
MNFSTELKIVVDFFIPIALAKTTLEICFSTNILWLSVNRGNELDRIELDRYQPGNQPCDKALCQICLTMLWEA